MATGAACWRVFNTTELLEQVLLNLVVMPARDTRYDFCHPVVQFGADLSAFDSYREGYRTLLRCLRADTTFRGTITASSLIQQDLFFKSPQTSSQQPVACPLLPFMTIKDFPQCSVSVEFEARETVQIIISGCTWEQAAPMLAKNRSTSSALRVHLGSAGCKVTRIFVADRSSNAFDYAVDLIDATVGEVLDQAARMQLKASPAHDV